MSNPDRQTYIIVLGHLINKDGSLNTESAQRVSLATQIEAETASQALILCGWDYRDDSDITISGAMKRHIECKRPELASKLLIQPLSRDTVGDAFFSRILLQQINSANNPNIIVATSDYHAKRTLDIFNFIFHGYARRVDVRGSETDGDDNSRHLPELQSTMAFRKTFCGIAPGDVHAIRDAMACTHPFYNGSIYPKIGSLETIANELQQLALSR